MSMDGSKTVSDLAREFPSATRVFERMGIEYCCSGGQTLTVACVKAKRSVTEVESALAEAERDAAARGQLRDWQAEPLAELIRHIIERHHAFTRSEIARLGPLANKVSKVHGQNHQELLRIQGLFEAMSAELNQHMMKEEQVLFPYIVRLEEAQQKGQPAPEAGFGSAEAPVRMMMNEHESTGVALERIREASSCYALPADACESYRALYEGLRDFEADLHQHIHLENNILFPRTLEKETACG
ncbi:MAG: iron-sulfur cluster repair di-iron protein [Candidatus Acidiferrales bacterium]